MKCDDKQIFEKIIIKIILSESFIIIEIDTSLYHKKCIQSSRMKNLHLILEKYYLICYQLTLKQENKILFIESFQKQKKTQNQPFCPLDNNFQLQTNLRQKNTQMFPQSQLTINYNNPNVIQIQILSNSQAMKPPSKQYPKIPPKNTKQQPKQRIYVPIQSQNQIYQQQRESDQNSHVLQQSLNQLKRVNMELKQKQQIYIDKLIKLQQGLQKQHQQFIQLQGLYNQLYNSYKCKQQEIAQLQLKYRQSNRKKQVQTQQPLVQHLSLQSQLRKQISDKNETIQILQQRLQQSNIKIQELQKTINKLFIETSYIKTKQKINQSKNNLNNKIFQSLQQWQKLADNQKQDKIKLLYQNKFLTNRNNDLQNRIKQLEEFISQKQSQVMKLRQNNIFLFRQNSQNRLNRSSSKSPNKSQQKQNIPSSKATTIIDHLHNQNKQLKKQLQLLHDKYTTNLNITTKNNKTQYFVKQQQFFSFSRQDNQNNPSNHSSNQYHHKQSNKQLINFNKQDIHPKIITSVIINNQLNKKIQSPTGISKQHSSNDLLQELPPELEIQKLILNTKRKHNVDILQ